MYFQRKVLPDFCRSKGNFYFSLFFHVLIRYATEFAPPYDKGIIEEFAESQWTDLLLKMVEQTDSISFMKGLQFYLETRSTQLWFILLLFIDYLMAMTPGGSWTSILTFLFQLTLAPLDIPWSLQDHYISDWTKVYLVPEFYTMGLIYQPHSSCPYFYVTPLAKLLSKHTSEEAIRLSGHIILETNFKIYAYTNNTLSISILSLFVHLKTRFPNLVTGTLSRESCQRAFEKGISAYQILKYLEDHAHPQMKAHRTTKSILPTDKLLFEKTEPSVSNLGTNTSSVISVTIKDQLYLWESEKHRVKEAPAYLYSQFVDTSEYEKAKQFANQQGHLLYAMDSRRILIISQLGHHTIRSYMKDG